MSVPLVSDLNKQIMVSRLSWPSAGSCWWSLWNYLVCSCDDLRRFWVFQTRELVDRQYIPHLAVKLWQPGRLLPRRTQYGWWAQSQSRDDAYRRGSWQVLLHLSRVHVHLASQTVLLLLPQQLKMVLNQTETSWKAWKRQWEVSRWNWYCQADLRATSGLVHRKAYYEQALASPRN